jgi:hypothetical protein
LTFSAQPADGVGKVREVPPHQLFKTSLFAIDPVRQTFAIAIIV